MRIIGNFHIIEAMTHHFIIGTFLCYSGLESPCNFFFFFCSSLIIFVDILSPLTVKEHERDFVVKSFKIR